MSKAGDLKTLEELAGPAAGSTENSYQNASNDSYKRAKKWEAARGVGPDTGRGPVPPHLIGAIVERNKTSGPGSAWKFTPEPGSEAAARVTVMDEGAGKQLVSFAAPSSWAQGDTDVSVSTDLPLWYTEGEFMQSPFYYFEVTILSMTPSRVGTAPVVALGVATAPYPPFRLPGWHPHSTAIHSDDGRLFVSDPFGGRNFAPPFGPSDVIGIGYYPTTGATFFTRNGSLILSGSGQGVPGWDGSLVPGDASYSVVWGEKTVHGIVGCDAGCVLKVDFSGPFRYPAGNPSWWRDGTSRGWVPPPGGPHLPVVIAGGLPPISTALPPYVQQGEIAPSYTEVLGSAAGPVSESNVPPPCGDGMGKV
ncbi:hypothetical protein M427DRAFT_154038 [Gonapodya prolifera JEL478]|uniref:B30.2/SPRY domain-containing protein n=1 Tax=Gonapodya prolifera (strain JEL478) TaxID=1344416 RepID=A0A139AL49_GONPJ|nr:hypothetical protein M427DRAFT_154038 [Gonapodya prolifera JEL478]|eukprot:KXS17254.1 hypothetical protein M427DRAFT_154038 [Gonapodya prolifera JEL478]